MKKLLVISAFVPYKKVPHAGGKTHYYYLCEYAKMFDVTLISFAHIHEIETAKKDLNSLHIQYSIIEWRGELWRSLIDLESRFNPFNRNCRMVSNSDQILLYKHLRDLYKSGYKPDIILLEWTQMLIACRKIKRFFPEAKIVASEHDVTFLAYERKCKKANGIRRFVKRIDYILLKKREIEALKNKDLVIVHNEKDKILLENNGILNNKLFTMVPYFSNLRLSKNSFLNKNILFFGDMSRVENYESAIWFIENIFHNLHGYKFIILGNNPCDVLFKYQSDDIIITGFVEDIQPYFDNAFCFVAPLILGGGIKVKVLEAFTTGLPILTNTIGIEGIPAEDGRDFIYCEEPDDYIRAINWIENNKSLAKQVGANGKSFIENSFNLDNSVRELIKELNFLVKDY